MRKFSLTATIGDCLVAGAAIQQLSIDINERVGYHTNSVLKDFFIHHPNIEYLENDEGCYQIKWASSVDRKLFRLNSVNRYALQIGAICDQSCVLNIFDSNKKRIEWGKKQDTIVINCSSAETNRRFIPQETIDYILSKNLAKNVVFVGNSHGQETCKDIPTIAKLLVNCKFLIGPVSFPYHLAQCLKTPTLAFFSYVTDYKFSNFNRIFSVSPSIKESCATFCEEDEHNVRNSNNCWTGCKLPHLFSKRDIDYQLEKIMEFTK